MTRTILAVAIAILVSLVAVSGFAQDIVKLNEEGIAAFQEGRFEDAATKFRQAYELEPEQTLKKNEALAWFKAGKCTEALQAADQYLALNPTDELSIKEANAVVVKCSIQDAEEALAARDFDAAEQLLTRAETNAPTPEDVQEIAALRGNLTAEREKQAEAERIAAQKAEEQRQREAAAASQSTKKVLGLSLAAAGGAIVVGTLAYHLAMALGTAPRFKETAASGEDRAEYEKLGKRLETANWLIPTLYAVGLGTGGVGAYLWWSAGSGESNPQAAAPNTNAKTVGVTLTWRF